jgi:hypothetical protein
MPADRRIGLDRPRARAERVSLEESLKTFATPGALLFPGT